MRNSNRGFTLIEILIAIFIFAIISVITTGVLSTVFSTRAQTNKHTNELGQLQIAMVLIQRDIEQMVNRPVRAPNGNSIAAFIPGGNQIEFTRIGYPNPLGLLQRSSLQRVRYAVSGGKLIRTTWPRLDRVSNTKPNNKVLLNNVTSLQFAYIGNGSTVYKSWPPGNLVSPPGSIGEILPRAIIVNLSIKNWGKLSLLIPVPSSQLSQYGKI